MAQNFMIKPSSTPDQESDTGTRRIALLVASMAGFITPFMGSSLNIALVSISQEFTLSAVVVGWIPTIFLLATAVFLIPFGRIADIYGRKKVFLFGVILYTISCLFTPFARSVEVFLLLRVLGGIGSAGMFSTGLAILTSIFPARERGKVLGINVASVYAGLSLGPPLGGLLTQHLTWRSIFIINVPLGLIIIALVLWKLKGEWIEARGEKVDVTGSIIYGIALAVLIVGFSLVLSIVGILLLIGGIAGLFFFVRWEMKTESPALNVNLFRHNPTFTLSGVAALINYSATAASGFLLSLYLQYIKGFTPQHAGLILIAQPVVMAILSPFAGRLSDRLEPRIVASLGMTLTTIGLVSLVFLGEDSSIAAIVFSLIVLGLGFGLFSSPNTNAIMSSVNKKFYGVASGIVSTMRLLGQMFSLATATLLFSIYIGSAQITPENYEQFLNSAHTAFVIFAVLCFGGIFASLARGKIR